jgi:alpha,alpha-trehalase
VHLTLRIFLLALFIIASGKAEAHSCGVAVRLQAIYSIRLPWQVGDPITEEALVLGVHPDGKYLSDLEPILMTPKQRRIWENQAAKLFPDDRAAQVNYLLGHLFRPANGITPVGGELAAPKWRLPEGNSHGPAFQYTEEAYQFLLMKSPAESNGSFIPVKNPFLVAGRHLSSKEAANSDDGRFGREWYYHDSWYGQQGLQVTGRDTIARGQIDNLLDIGREKGIIPNGGRTYYLSRSQPPVISFMVKDYLGDVNHMTPEKAEWLKTKVLPVLESDYLFWMTDRHDAETKLNKHGDEEATAPRPERVAADHGAPPAPVVSHLRSLITNPFELIKELIRLKVLGLTERDIRAEAETGKDFTVAFEGEASKFSPVMLNAFMFKYETNMRDFYKALGNTERAKFFEEKLIERKKNFEILWNAERKNYYDYRSDQKRHSVVLTADIFAVLEAGLVPEERMGDFLNSCEKLIGKGGVMASDYESGRQWDGKHAWAPHQFLAIKGLLDYAERIQANDPHNPLAMKAREMAKRIADGWTSSVEKVYRETGFFYEKYDGLNGGRPQDDTAEKYANQIGFLWTNSIYVWVLDRVYHQKFEAIKPTP